MPDSVLPSQDQASEAKPDCMPALLLLGCWCEAQEEQVSASADLQNSKAAAGQQD